MMSEDEGYTLRGVIVQCTNAKRDGSHPARDLYDESTYFKKQRRFAEEIGDYWFIQSAEHGLVNPSTTIESYDTHAGDIDDPEAWAKGIAEDLTDSPLQPGDTIVVLGGSDYADPLVPELERLGYDVVEPLRGLSIGERMSKLNEMVNEAIHAKIENAGRCD